MFFFLVGEVYHSAGSLTFMFTFQVACFNRTKQAPTRWFFAVVLWTNGLVMRKP